MTSPITVVLLGLPVTAGLLGTLLPAFGWFPPLGGGRLSLEPWRDLLQLPGLGTSLTVSLATGLATTALSLVLVAAFCAGWHGTRPFAVLVRLLSPLLSVPHAAVAFGIAFLVSPSGWIIRLLSPWLTGFTTPPDWLVVHDRHGLTLIAGLVAKEVPFLLLVSLGALGQVDAARSWTVAQTLGYTRMNGWLKVVFPPVYRQIRLPVLAVLAYSVSVVDVAMILGPTTPAPLAVRLVQLFNDPDLTLRFPASAGALVQLFLAAIGIACWLTLESVVCRIGRQRIFSGSRGRPDFLPRLVTAGAFIITTVAAAASLLGLILWSFTRSWRFPNFLPSSLTLDNWGQHLVTLQGPLFNTVIVGASAALISLVLAVGVLEHEAQAGHKTFTTAGGLLYLPLLVPQIAFLLGGQMLLVLLRLDGGWLALTWLHLVFVFPYAFLSLADAYRAWDSRYARTGLCLGAAPLRVFAAVKLPMLLRPVLAAGAVGFAVSVGLYLPTLFAGSGRFPTVTTEAVALSAGGDNRLVGVYALLQMGLPLVGFTIAGVVPSWLFRQRHGMQVTR